MCGRYVLMEHAVAISAQFELFEPTVFEPRYNVAPTDVMLVIRKEPGVERRFASEMRWGLVPFWAKDLSIGARMINARAETVRTKRAFAESFEMRRCIIPLSGFYEWEKRGKKRFPHLIRDVEDRYLGCAGLWSRWRNKEDGEVVETFTILTTTPNGPMSKLHDRMPVILDPTDYGTWLDESSDPETLEALLKPCPDDRLRMYPVDPEVNSVGKEDPRFAEPWVPSQLDLFD